MSALRELYQEVILDHAKSPRNAVLPADANRRSEGFNPLCGDRVTVALRVGDRGVIEEVGFSGNGCAISQAAASTMTEAVRGLPVERAKELFEIFRELVTGQRAPSDALGKLAVFGGVREFPMRVKCATLPWHVLSAALAGEHEEVSTE